jgi:hypothetical protein
MGGVSRRWTVISRRAVVIGAVVVVSASGVAPSAAAPRDAAATTEPRTGDNGAQVTTSAAPEVRTVWTDEFGVARPAGLAYDPSRREFLVAADDPSGTTAPTRTR